jgi:hypothetical protein
MFRKSNLAVLIALAVGAVGGRPRVAGRRTRRTASDTDADIPPRGSDVGEATRPGTRPTACRSGSPAPRHAQQKEAAANT